MTEPTIAVPRALAGPAYLHALAALVEHAPVGMCVIDSRGTYVVVNEALAKINGLPIAAHIGRTVADVVPDLYARATEAIEHALQSPTPVVDMLMEGETPASPGEKRFWLESWFPLPREVVDDVLVAIIVREVTAERRLTLELKEADRRKDEFLATLAHELRNPLAPLTHCVPLLRSLTDPVAGRIASILERQLGTLTRLVDDLSDASRVGSGKFDLHLSRIDLVDVLRDAIATCAGDANKRGHAVNADLPEHPVFVRGDAVRLKQLCCNLLTNACKFTPPGGRIAVELNEVGTLARIAVIDSGIGIAPHRLHSIFARLAQGDAPPAMRAQGLGIGLWLAREIAEMHGGRIEAHSDGPGCGSRFEVRLPLFDDERSPGEGR